MVLQFNKFCKFLEEIENRIKNEYIQNYNFKIRLEFEGDKFYNISCIYAFIPPYIDESNTEINSFKDDNILLNKTKTYGQGFDFFISEINLKTYKNNEDNKNNNLPIFVRNQINDSNLNDITGIDTANLTTEDQIRLKKQEIKNYSIIEIPTILASHNDEEGKSFCSAEFIKQLSNGYYICGGTNNKLYVYTRTSQNTANFMK